MVPERDGLGVWPDGRVWDVATGECRTTAVTGGELLLNYDGVKAANGLGKARRSRLMIVQDAAGSAYIVVLNGALASLENDRVLNGRRLQRPLTWRA